MTPEICQELDRSDPLSSFRERFVLPEGVIYLDGNSLGPPPRTAQKRLDHVVSEEWGRGLIRSWTSANWIHQPQRLGDKIARIIGATAGSVIACDGTSINLFKLLAAAMKLRPERRVILSDRGNFPTDLYVASGLVELLEVGHELRLVEPHEVREALTEEVGVLMLTEVDYRTGRRHDMVSLNDRAHQVGALTLWDLAHSAGAFQINIADKAADLAVGCGYKYLNGGPGAPAYLYVAPDLQETIKPPLSGWFGHQTPFAFDLDYQPAKGIRRNLCGTHSVLAMSVFEEALDLMLEVDLAAMEEKSRRLCDSFIALVENRCKEWDFTLLSPRDASRRGSQVAFSHPEGYAIMQALIEAGVIGDFRAPDVVRFGFAPLYLRYSDIWQAVDRLVDIMEKEIWRDPRFQDRGYVT